MSIHSRRSSSVITPNITSSSWAGFTPATKNEAILGYAYDFNKTWRVQVDWQRGKENSSTIGFTCNLTRDFQFNPAIYFSNDDPRRLMCYIVFTCTFHLWGEKEQDSGLKDAK